ncbi:hypothetical protein [Rhizobium anhuiense]|uniref:hypothetical protein n=1 Tax=Rhizobium anhuiense TaxID=1184720 RepID=UPI001179976E|nr:hypothetical protein [Rhizobium anhuiense]
MSEETLTVGADTATGTGDGEDETGAGPNLASSNCPGLSAFGDKPNLLKSNSNSSLSVFGDKPNLLKSNSNGAVGDGRDKAFNSEGVAYPVFGPVYPLQSCPTFGSYTV